MVQGPWLASFVQAWLRRPSAVTAVYSHPVKSEMLSPTGHPVYFPGMQGMGHPHPPIPPYQHPTGYEYMQGHHRPWTSPPAMRPMPPPGMQFGSVWHARPEVQPSNNNNRKRRRRTSSISSNGGNSDTGYTSGLSSPAHTSPSQSKLHEKVDVNSSKSKVIDERRLHPAAETSVAVKSSEESKQMCTSRSPDARSSNQHVPAYETSTARHTSVIRSPESRLPHQYAPAHDIPLPPYYTNLNYQSLKPPTDRPHGPAYTQQNARAQVMKGVYSRPPLQNPAQAVDSSTEELPVAHSIRSEALTTEGGNFVRTDKLNTGMSSATPNDASEPQDLTKSNGVPPQLASETQSQANQHPGMMPPVSPFVQQPMYMNGFQAAQLNSHMVPPMPYPPSGHPGLPGEFSYPPRPPVHMVRAPNGQMFYRYTQPRMPMPPQVMPYPTDSPMYPPMPFMVGQNTPFAYPSASNSIATSPKRKKKKAGTKTVIESHSAVLARPDIEPDTMGPSNSAERENT